MNLPSLLRPGRRVVAGGAVVALAGVAAIVGVATGQTGDVAPGTAGPTATVARRDLSTSSSATGSLQRTAERTIAHLAEQVLESPTGTVPAMPSPPPSGAAPSAGASPGGPATASSLRSVTGQPPTSGGPSVTEEQPAPSPAQPWQPPKPTPEPIPTPKPTPTPIPTPEPTPTPKPTPTPAPGPTPVPTSEVAVTRLSQVATDEGGPGGQGGGTATVLAATGSTVDVGTVLYRVDTEPVLALIGPLPAYRELSSSATDGVDIRQLEDNLAALGYGAGLTVDEEFTDATAESVRQWEEDLGRADPDGTVELGDVVFLPEPAEIVRHDAAVGDRVDAGSPVLTIAARTDVVLADVTFADATKWVAGSPVELRWPDGTAQPAIVVGVGRIITDPGDGAAPTVEVTLTPTGDTAARPVGSEVTAVLTGETRDSSLAVPVSALLAAPDGAVAVRRVQPESEVTIPVTAGLVDGSWVEITAGLVEGDQVRLPG